MYWCEYSQSIGANVVLNSIYNIMCMDNHVYTVQAIVRVRELAMRNKERHFLTVGEWS